MPDARPMGGGRLLGQTLQYLGILRRCTGEEVEANWMFCLGVQRAKNAGQAAAFDAVVNAIVAIDERPGPPSQQHLGLIRADAVLVR